MSKPKTFYRRNLPHYQPIGGTFFVTAILKGTIPKSRLQKLLIQQKEAFLYAQTQGFSESDLALIQEGHALKYGDLLQASRMGPHYFKIPTVAQLAVDTFHRFDGVFYKLLAYCVMSNHFHILIDTSIQGSKEVGATKNYTQLDQIMKRIKGPISVGANRILDRSGQFWERESYDHCVRTPRALENIRRYILENPVKAKLVKRWEDWPYTFLREEQ